MHFHPGNSDASHVFRSLRRGVTDVLAFSIIVLTARRSGRNRYPGIPSLLDTILRDATLYFTFIFFCQVSAQLFLYVNQVGVICYVVRVINSVVLTVSVCSGNTSALSRDVSFLSRCRRDLLADRH